MSEESDGEEYGEHETELRKCEARVVRGHYPRHQGEARNDEWFTEPHYPLKCCRSKTTLTKADKMTVEKSAKENG